MKTRTMECRTCHFHDAVTVDGEVDHLECHRYPPVLDRGLSGRARPIVEADEWCGEWSSDVRLLTTGNAQHRVAE